MTEVNFKEDVKPKIVKSKKPIAINSPVKQQHRIIETDENNNYNFSGEIPNELTGGLKNIIIYGYYLWLIIFINQNIQINTLINICQLI